MSCGRSREIDLAAFLVDPASSEWAEFREHYPRCPDCARQVGSWTRVVNLVRDERAEDAASAHLSEDHLLAYRRAPGAFAPHLRAQIDAHLAGCAPCRSELAVLRGFDFARLAPKPDRPSLLRALLDRVRGLFELPAPALAAVAAAVLALAVSLPFFLRERGGPSDQPPPLARQESPPPSPRELEPEPRGDLLATEEAPAEPVAPPAPEPEPPEELVASEQRPPPAPAPSPSEPEPTRGEAPSRRMAEGPRSKLAPQSPPAPGAPGAPRKREPVEETWVIASLGPAPLLYAARTGLPPGRVGGVTRAGPSGEPRPVALVPERVGLTLEAQPTLYWFLPEPSPQPLRVRVNDIDALKPLLSTTVEAGTAGIHALSLRDQGVRLELDRNYEWLVAVEGEDSGGILRRVAPDAALRGALAEGDPAERLRRLAGSGIWYDAFDLLSRSIERRPKDAALRRGRAELLDQVGLQAPAAWDRSSP